MDGDVVRPNTTRKKAHFCDKKTLTFFPQEEMKGMRGVQSDVNIRSVRSSERESNLLEHGMNRGRLRRKQAVRKTAGADVSELSKNFFEKWN